MTDPLKVAPPVNSPVDALRGYLTNPGPFWVEGLGWRQSRKLLDFRQSAAQSAGMSEVDVIDEVISAAIARSKSRPPPIYVVNLGGSGSHWVADMLGELPGLCDIAEVYVPAGLLEYFETASLPAQAMVVDGIYLLHGWGNSKDWKSARGSRLVNTAHRPEMIRTFREWDPGCLVVHLFRDPRDRALSLTYRKKEYRDLSAPGVDDETYLRSKANRGALYLRRYRHSKHQADLELRYESLRRNPIDEIERVARAAGVAVTRDHVAKAAYLHDASNVRAGKVHSSGNLDEGGISRGWRDASARDRLLMHHMLADAILFLRYERDDCLARDVISETHGPAREVPQWMVPMLDQSSDGSPWSPLEDDRIMANSKARLCFARGDDVAKIEERVDLCRPDVLCLAGVRELKNEDLGFLRGRSGIQGLDVAGTGVTSELIPIIDSMPDLLWISATDTDLEEWSGRATARRSKS